MSDDVLRPLKINSSTLATAAAFASINSQIDPVRGFQSQLPLKVRRAGQAGPATAGLDIQKMPPQVGGQDKGKDKDPAFHMPVPIQSNNSMAPSGLALARSSSQNNNQGFVRVNNWGQLPMFGHHYWDPSLIPLQSQQQVSQKDQKSDPKEQKPVSTDGKDEKQSEGPLKISYDFDSIGSENQPRHHLWLPHCRFNCFGPYVSIQLDFLRNLLNRELHDTVQVISWFHPSFGSWQKNMQLGQSYTCHDHAEHVL